MPTYEYKCENCGHEFETYQSMKDEKLTKCPNCGRETLKRLIGSGGGLIFKGSGFYLTDYKNKPGESAKISSSDTKQKEPAKVSADTKTDSSKPEPVKSDTKTTAERTSKKPEKNSASSKSNKE